MPESSAVLYWAKAVAENAPHIATAAIKSHWTRSPRMIRTVGNAGESAVPVAYETDTAGIIGFRSEADHSVSQGYSTFNPQFDGGTIDDICADLGLGKGRLCA